LQRIESIREQIGCAAGSRARPSPARDYPPSPPGILRSGTV